MQILISILLICLVVSLYLVLVEPSINVVSIDWENKSVKYRISVGRYTLKGIKAFHDKNTTNAYAGNHVIVVSAEGKGFVLAVTKDNKIIKGIRIDLYDKTINKITVG